MCLISFHGLFNLLLSSVWLLFGQTFLILLLGIGPFLLRLAIFSLCRIWLGSLTKLVFRSSVFTILSDLLFLVDANILLWRCIFILFLYTVALLVHQLIFAILGMLSLSLALASLMRYTSHAEWICLDPHNRLLIIWQTNISDIDVHVYGILLLATTCTCLQRHCWHQFGGLLIAVHLKLGLVSTTSGLALCFWLCLLLSFPSVILEAMTFSYWVLMCCLCLWKVIRALDHVWAQNTVEILLWIHIDMSC